MAYDPFVKLLSGTNKEGLLDDLVSDSIIVTGPKYIEFELKASLWYARHFLARPRSKSWWR